MAGVNKAIIMGYIGRQPELAYTKSNMAKCVLAIATSRKRKNGEEITAWHKVTAFDKQAEVIAQYFSKGMMIYIEGELSYGQYEKDGHKVYTTDIFVREFAFCGSPSARNDTQNQNQPQEHYQQPIRQHQQQPAYPVNQGYDGQALNHQQQDDDIPF